MNNQLGYGEVRVTVQEFAEISKISKQDIDASDTCFYANRNYFWEEQFPKVENKLRDAGAEELIPIFHDAPASQVWNLLHHHPDSLMDYLWVFKQAIKEGTLKLSKLQKKILLTLYEQTIMAIRPAEWTPTESLESQTRADCSAISRAVKRLKERGLIAQHSEKKGNTPKRITHVKFTHLGFLVAKQIFHSQEDSVKQSFLTSLKTKLRNG